MALKAKLSREWQDWKFGAVACVLLALQAGIAVAGSALFSAAILIPGYWLVGTKAPDSAFYNLAFVLSVILVPISVKIAVETLSEMASEAKGKGYTE